MDNEFKRMDEKKKLRGLYNKFIVTRSDGRDRHGERHDGCEYFVLDITHDYHARAALQAYAASCADEYPQLARDLLEKARMVGYGNLPTAGM